MTKSRRKHATASEDAMNLLSLEKRVRTLEAISIRESLKKASGCRSSQQENSNPDDEPWVRELEEVRREAVLITKQAQTAGDLQTALASIRVRCYILELAARLGGGLDERSPTSIVNVSLDPETAMRIAETYLERRKPTKVEAT
jgi:hypothetical protein